MSLGLALKLSTAPLFKGVGVLRNNSRLIIDGDSISTLAEPITDLILRTNGKLYLPAGYNQAVSGSTSADVVSRISSVTSRSPKIVKLLIGTNDLGITSDTPAVIFARIRQCVEAYRAAGARVLQHLVLPRNDAAWLALSAGRRADLAILNGLIASQNDVILADATATFDPSTDTLEGLHPNWSGARKIAAAEAAKLNPLLTGASLVTMYADASNLGPSQSPDMSGTGGSAGTGVTGQVASNWASAMGGGMLATARKVTIASGPAAGLTAQEFEVSGTNAGSGNVCQLTQTITTTGTTGDEFDLWVYFELDAGHQNVQGPQIFGDTNGTPQAARTLDGSQALSGVLRAPILTPLAAPDTSNAIFLRVYFAAGTVSAKFRWAARFLRKVPAGQ